MINTRAQRKLLHTWIILSIAKHNLAQIGRIGGPTEYLSQRLATIKLNLTPLALVEVWGAEFRINVSGVMD